MPVVPHHLVLKDLNGFDMVYAVSQATLNDQLELLSALNSLPETWNASLENGLYAIQAQLGVPSISLNTGDSSSRKVALRLPLSQATLRYASIDLDKNGNPIVDRKEVDISGASLRLVADLSLSELAASYKDDARIPPEVSAQLSHFDDSMFSVQRLFMNLEDTHLLNTFEFDTQGKVDMTQPELVGRVRDLISAYVNELKGSKNPYLFGYAVTDKRAVSVDATWKPTGVTFSVFSDVTSPEKSSLNYLLNTRNKPILGGGSGLFPFNWVTQDDTAGAFVFGPNLVLDQIVTALTQVLPVARDDFSVTNEGKPTASFSNAFDGRTTIIVNPRAGSANISLDFHITFRQNIHDEAGTKIGYIDGYIDQSSVMTFSVSSKDASVSVSVQNGEPQTHKTDHPNLLGKIEHFLAKAADFLLKIVSTGQVHDLFQRLADKSWHAVVIAQISASVQSTRMRVILPAGSQFFFKDCRFLDDGTLALVATIQD